MSVISFSTDSIETSLVDVLSEEEKMSQVYILWFGLLILQTTNGKASIK